MKDSYLANGVKAAQVVALFDAARALWAAAPWDVVATDDSLLRVSSGSLGLDGAVVSVIGQHRTMFGFGLFPGGLDDFSRFERAGRMGVPALERSLTLVYPSRHELSVHLRRQVQKFGWRLPADGRYPLCTTADHRGPRASSSAEVDQLEAVARAICELIRVEPNLGDVTFGLGSFEHTLGVETFSGSHQLKISAPCIPPPDEDDDITSSLS